MKQQKKRENLVRIPLRHSESVNEFLNEQSAKENIPLAVLYRKVFNAGLKSLYGLEIRNNQIVK